MPGAGGDGGSGHWAGVVTSALLVLASPVALYLVFKKKEWL